MLIARTSHAVDPPFTRCLWDHLGCRPPWPSPEELQALACANGQTLRVISVSEDGRPAAMSLCTVENRQLSGVRLRSYSSFGTNFYDYSHLYYTTDASLSKLLEEMRTDAASEKADVIYLSSLAGVNPNTPALRGKISNEETCLFDSTLAPKGWQEILGKKSLRWRWNKVRKAFAYEVVAKTSDILEEDIAIMGDFHQERWAFDDIESPFESGRRAAEYASCLENRLYLRVAIDGEPFAILYAMLYGDTMVFHTSVINIKYLDYSPMTAIIAEAASYCSQHGLRTLDFGVGDESYKTRFMNTARPIYTMLLPISARGRVLAAARSTVNPATVKERAKNTRRWACSVKDHLLTRVNKLNTYETTGSAEGAPEPCRLGMPSSWEDFVDFCRRNRFTIRRVHYDRYKAGDVFAGLVVGSEVVSFGWIARRDTFRIDEIARTVDTTGGIMFYDFNTPEQHRRRGYYTELLRSLIASFPGETLWISALTGNVASNKAIVRARFQPCPLWKEAAPAPPGGDEAGGQ